MAEHATVLTSPWEFLPRQREAGAAMNFSITTGNEEVQREVLELLWAKQMVPLFDADALLEL